MLPLLPPAQVEVDSTRRYVAVNDAACNLLGYTREELLSMTIDDLSYPSGAHVDSMFERYEKDGSMTGVFALRCKSGKGVMVRFDARQVGGRMISTFTHYAPLKENGENEPAAFGPAHFMV